MDMHVTSIWYKLNDCMQFLGPARFVLHSNLQFAMNSPCLHCSYLCKDSAGKSVVAKFVAGPYPQALHEELASKFLAPQLLSTSELPGGFTYVEMEYMDPSEGWVQVS